MKSRIACIARHTLLEALRTRLPLVAAVVAFLIITASFFVREIAIAESVRFQTAFYAAAMRFATVFIVTLCVISSIAREFQDKGFDVVLALDLPRSHYALGKLGGFVVIAIALSAAAGAPLLFMAGFESAIQWTLSLAVELGVVVALAFFCAITFNQIVPAAGFVLAFYLLARAITAVRLIGANPIAGADSLSHQVSTALVEALALLTPALDQWTRTAWIVDEPAAWAALARIVAHGALFVAIFGAAAVFDLYRKNF